MDLDLPLTSLSEKDLDVLLQTNDIVNIEDESFPTVRGIEAFRHLLPPSFFRNTFRKVLVVEDDRAIQRIYLRFLDQAGFDVCCADNGLEAVAKIHQYKPSFVITDLNMPEMDGLELCQTLRRVPLVHYLYILLVTSHNKISDYVSGIAAGADDFISKPIRVGEILSRLQAGTRFLELEARLHDLGQLDSITGLFSRDRFAEVLQRQWSLAVRQQRPISCAMLEVDSFQHIIDKYGESDGNQVLRAISRILQRTCRGSDYICRYGREKFCILLSESPATDALMCAERCQQMFMAMPIHLSEHDVSITLSASVAERSPEDIAPEQMLERADQSLLTVLTRGLPQ
jgi:two-component system, cell cycle response regulator